MATLFFFFFPVALCLAAALGFPLVAGSEGYSLDAAHGLLVAWAIGNMGLELRVKLRLDIMYTNTYIVTHMCTSQQYYSRIYLHSDCGFVSIEKSAWELSFLPPKV